jgi:hypothetical protein
LSITAIHSQLVSHSSTTIIQQCHPSRTAGQVGIFVIHHAIAEQVGIFVIHHALRDKLASLSSITHCETSWHLCHPSRIAGQVGIFVIHHALRDKLASFSSSIHQRNPSLTHTSSITVIRYCDSLTVGSAIIHHHHSPALSITHCQTSWCLCHSVFISVIHH